jgi:Coenzyme PQQ synthesis protein D (PqqD)
MSEAVTLDTVIARRDDLLTSELSDTELVMLNIDRSSYYGMEDTAKAIWHHLDEPRSIAAVCARLRTQFAVDQETCEREVLAFVNEMVKEELVHVVEA